MRKPASDNTPSCGPGLALREAVFSHSLPYGLSDRGGGEDFGVPSDGIEPSVGVSTRRGSLAYLLEGPGLSHGGAFAGGCEAATKDAPPLPVGDGGALPSATKGAPPLPVGDGVALPKCAD